MTSGSRTPQIGLAPLTDRPSEEYSLLDYLTIAQKRWPWIAASALLLVGAAAIYALTRPPRFEATASVLLADTASQRTLDPSSQNPGFRSRELSNEITLARSDAVETLVSAVLGIEPEVEVTAEPDSDVLVFTALAPSATDAAEHANAWAEIYVELKREQAVANIGATSASLRSRLTELREQRQDLRQPLDDLDARIARTTDPDQAAALQSEYDRLADDLRYELQLVTSQADATTGRLTDLDLQAELAAVGVARIIQVATPPDESANLPLATTIAIGAVVGLGLGAALALLAELRDNTLTSAADVATVSDVPVLASVPKADPRRLQLATAALLEPDGTLADAYHKARSSLEFLSLDGEIRSLMITSANPSEGKSTTSANLAVAMASVGRRTVLLDLDFRRATLHEVFNVSQSPGLSDHVLFGPDVGSVTYSFNEQGLGNLLLIPTGSVPPNPAAFVGTREFGETVDWIGSQADVVVIDAPPLLAVSDAHTLGKHVDAVVVTARAGSTTRSELAEVLGTLNQIGARVAGVILIGVDEADAIGRFGSYYQEIGRPGPDRSRPATDLWEQATATGSIDLRDTVTHGSAAHGSAAHGSAAHGPTHR